MPVYNPELEHLRAAIESVCNQVYPFWELCIADDASTGDDVRDLLERVAARDARVKVTFRSTNGHIAAATNSAFELAEGEWIALLDHDDLLREHALAEVALALTSRPDAQLIYTDEDKINPAGRRVDPFFKPDYAPDLFRSQNYFNHLTAHRAENIRRVGGWRVGFEGSQDYDLTLRILETIPRSAVLHVPKVLYHWRAAEGSTARSGSEKSYAYDAGLRALTEHVARSGIDAEALPIEGLPFYRIRYEVPTPAPLVSIIIPTKDRSDLLRVSIGSILEKTTYAPFEVVLVDNGSREPETFAYFEEAARDERVRVIAYPGPFNYSAINNHAVREAKGSLIALVNNDIEVITPEWLTEMVSQACRPEIGCVGAKLYYPNDAIQHAGVILGIGGVAGHSHKLFPRASLGYFARLRLPHNLSAVTGACLVVRREVFEEVGGLDEEKLAIAFNDVDFCLKVREAGYLNLFTPFAELYHHESVSRGLEDNPEKVQRFNAEVRTMIQRWGPLLTKDPFYSPHLTLEHEDFSIRLKAN
jgi:GT2 family glycosyltransferase